MRTGGDGDVAVEKNDKNKADRTLDECRYTGQSKTRDECNNKKKNNTKWTSTKIQSIHCHHHERENKQ